MASSLSTTPVKWVASDHDGLPMKRKQVAQACETCRKRKKRCIHTDGPPTRPASASGISDNRRPFSGPDGYPNKRSGSPRHHHAGSVDEEDARQVAANRLMELSSSRFISDLNPEGMFIQAATPSLQTAAGITHRDKNDLGIWLPPYARTAQGAQEDGASSGSGDNDGDEGGDGEDDNRVGQDSNGPVNGQDSSNNTSHGDTKQRRKSRPRRPTGRSAVSEAALNYERAKYLFIKECLAIYPPDEDFAVLHRIYCEKVHPLLPVLKDADLERASITPSTAPDLGSPQKPTSSTTPSSQPTPSPHPPQSAFTASIFPTVVKQIIALSAATTDGEAAAPHLRLEPNGPLLSPREFHHRLTDAVSTILDADMIAHRFDYIRATILLSFFYQPTAEIDRNKPSFLCTQAAHHFQTIGAHLLGYRPEQPDDDVDRVFCALWALDRLASVLYARPCMMHAYDNGKNAEDCIAKQPPCFRLFMSVILWLDKVIHLYRPRQPFVMIDIPVYEALILDAQAEKLPAMLLGTIEILYHTVCVLSCRQPLSAFSEVSDVSQLNRDDRTYLPISIMNPRRSHSSDRIVWVTQTQPICLFPYVPYAVSIALSVQYKKMRYSRTPLFRTRARVGFKDIVALLKSMGDVFINARVNAALGESIWRQMEKTAENLCREEAEGSGTAVTGGAVTATGGTASSKTGTMGPPPAPGTNGVDKKNALSKSNKANAASASHLIPTGPVSSNVSAAAAPAASFTPTAAATGAATASTETTATTAARSTDSLPPTIPQASQSSYMYPGVTTSTATITAPGTTTITAGPSTTNTMQPHLQAMAPITSATTTAGGGITADDAALAQATTQQQPQMLGPGLQPQIDLSVLDSLDTDIDLFGNFDPSFDLGAIDTALEANLDMAIPQNWPAWNNLN
ncbi:hypothetical protein SBRCBS47491_000694 [Sporothrix bragantina]|uniref:Transcription factor domain-containing protein n=1 Tax=Sporothrix bragantina TaxID=671064 RepID=A0ABP0ASG0_9PEZI